MSDTELSCTERAREEAVSAVRKNPCCRRAFLLAYLWGAGKESGDIVYLKAKGEVLCLYLVKLIKEQLGRDTETKRVGKRGDSFELSFSSSHAIKMINEPLSEYEKLKKCPFCISSVLSGLICSCVSINEPQKDYYLSVRVDTKYKEVLCAVFESADIFPSYRINGTKGVFYLRASNAIEDFLAASGMQKLLFDFINCKIEKDFRNNANRVRNTEMKNIKKSLGAAKRYITAIKWLSDRDRLLGLDAELYEAAQLRVKNPDLSLSALGTLFSPPISKSGVVHRLNRIYEIYENNLKK